MWIQLAESCKVLTAQCIPLGVGRLSAAAKTKTDARPKAKVGELQWPDRRAQEERWT